MTDPLFDVAGRVVVVTGGLGQLGATYASALAERGAKVAILDVADPPDGAEGDATRVWRVDVTDRASLEAALAEIERAWGVPHALVNNAAIDRRRTLRQTRSGRSSNTPKRRSTA